MPVAIKTAWHVAVVSESNGVGCHIVAFLSFQRRGHQGDKKADPY
jgi:hypothetical protein